MSRKILSSTTYLISLSSLLLIASCKPALPVGIDNISEQDEVLRDQNKSILTIPKLEAVSKSNPKPLDLCLRTLSIATRGVPLKIATTQKLIDKYSIVFSGEGYVDNSSASCKIYENEIVQFTLNGTKMSLSLLPKPPLTAGEFRAITQIAHRPFTSTGVDGAIIKYFGRLDFLAPDDSLYCVTIRHKSPTDGANSIKLGMEPSDLRDINLPVSGDEIGSYVIDDSKVSLLKGEEKVFWVSHRENTLTYGYTIDHCP